MTEETTNGEVLVVASKLKKYIKATSGMNTSAGVLEILSEQVRTLCDKAMENAKTDGRKTVKDRDIPTALQGGC
jgi:histone H3/H4